MIKESRQVKRARQRREAKSGNAPATLEEYYVPIQKTTKRGVIYTTYKKVIDIIGLNNK